MLIPEHEQRELLIYAFRYALGRKTYAVSTVANIIKDSWNKLSENDKKLIRREIDEALATGAAGHDMDRQQWQSIMKMEKES